MLDKDIFVPQRQGGCCDEESGDENQPPRRTTPVHSVQMHCRRAAAVLPTQRAALLQAKWAAIRKESLKKEHSDFWWRSNLW